MVLLNICDSESVLCNSIQKLFNELIEDYQKILFRKESVERILTHSGSAPINGWIKCISSNHTIADAIHSKAIKSHSAAELHFRENYT